MFKQRDIVLIPLPFTDLSSTKQRPVVVISNDDYNSKTSSLSLPSSDSTNEKAGYFTESSFDAFQTLVVSALPDLPLTHQT